MLEINVAIPTSWSPDFVHFRSQLSNSIDAGLLLKCRLRTHLTIGFTVGKPVDI